MRYYAEMLLPFGSHYSVKAFRARRAWGTIKQFWASQKKTEANLPGLHKPEPSSRWLHAGLKLQGFQKSDWQDEVPHVPILMSFMSNISSRAFWVHLGEGSFYFWVEQEQILKMNMVRLPSGVSDTDRIGKPAQRDYFGSNGAGIRGGWKSNVL